MSRYIYVGMSRYIYREMSRYCNPIVPMMQKPLVEDQVLRRQEELFDAFKKSIPKLFYRALGVSILVVAQAEVESTT